MYEDGAKGQVTSISPEQGEGRLPTRREFLGLTTAGLVATTAPAVATTTAVGGVPQAGPMNRDPDHLDALLRRYGSEFGEITQVG